MSKPQALYSVADARAIDRHAIEDLAIPAYELMSRAGAAALATAQHTWPALREVCVVCGPGNNGGDGLVFARLAREAGIEAEVVCVGKPPGKGAARQAFDDWQAAGGTITAFDGTLPRTGLVVDALFGIGLSRAPEGEAQQAIAAMNSASGQVLALDVPSGVDADTGAVPGRAVQADRTVTFIVHKRGLHTGPALEHCGEINLAGLDLPESVTGACRAAAEFIPADLVARHLGMRPENAHKGDYGHVLIIGGAPGMDGAVGLAGEAALRCGAGRVSIATHPGNRRALRDELMVHAVETATALAPLLERATVVAVGPGLGRDTWAQQLFTRALEAGLPTVVDADALNLLAEAPCLRDHWVLTPHPGEAARLLATDSAAVQSGRFAAVAELAERYGGTVVLKGAGTLVHRGDTPVAVCAAGNPGMATAGMGDVLTGVIAALLAQGLESGVAAQAGVMLHARAGDQAAAMAGPRGLLAGDLFGPLQRLVNGRA